MSNPRWDKPIQLTDHFSSYEFDCHDGTTIESAGLLIPFTDFCVETMEPLRKFFNAPIRVTSGYRTPEHNAKVGGASRSIHLCATKRPDGGLAVACDFTVQGIPTAQVYTACEGLIRLGEIQEGGLGLYKDWVHLDNRGYKARWIG